MALEEKGVSDMTERAERRGPLQAVSHECPAVNCCEPVLVAQALERAGQGDVGEKGRTVQFGDLRRQLLPDTEMHGLEDQDVAKLREAAFLVADQALFRVWNRARVGFQVPAEVETPLNRRMNLGG